MAVNKVYERQIVEVMFPFPNGDVISHPALVLSPGCLSDVEEGLFYAVLISTKNHHPEYTLEIPDEWLNQPMHKPSFFVTHLISFFTLKDVIQANNTFVKEQFFPKVLENVVHSVLGIEMELE